MQNVVGRLKRHRDVPSSVLLVGGRMIFRGIRSKILFGTRHAVLEEHGAAGH